jgi:hypothetical protein
MVMLLLMVLESVKTVLSWSKLVVFSKLLVTVQTMGCHPSWFPMGRTDGRPPIFDKDSIGCQLFQFPLIWRNNWQPRHSCIFWHLI